MNHSKIMLILIVIIFYNYDLISQTSQPVTSNQSPVYLKKPTDPLRECKNPERFRKTTPDNLILPDIAWGNNPQEAEYRQEVIRLLKIELANIDQAVKDIVEKHKELVKLYPELKEYQEIILEDNPGSWRDGIFVNSKKVLSIHYTQNGEIDCIRFHDSWC